MGRGNDHRRQRQFGTEGAEAWSDYASQPSYERPSHSNPSWSKTGSAVEARVKWFNPDKGFGFVELTDGAGEAFLHIRQVEAAGYPTLDPGTTLMVNVGAGQKGSQVNEILSVDASTAAPETPRRNVQGRAGQFGGISRKTISRAEYNPPTTPGVVKWFDPAKGYGFITVEGESKDLFVHISVLERAGLSTLAQGQAVRVAVVEGRKGHEVGAIEAV